MKRVILAGICLKDQRRGFEGKMEECRQLCIACGYEVVSTLVQNSQSMDRNTAFRKGKLEELAQLVGETGARLVVFMNPLGVQAAASIAETVGVNVIDRTSLILDIFAKNARTRQARLQTEMARLEYALPQMVHQDDGASRGRGGGVVNRGAGEMRSALIARKYRARIAELKKELAGIEKRRSQDERRRSRTLLKRAALIGYTNAGKSSFLNLVLNRYDQAGSEVESRDALFATLDTSVRSVIYRQYGFLLYDTVGFVSDLPSSLLDAFYSTLAAARDADVLIHVIDASDPAMDEKIAATHQALSRIGADEIPLIRVYNKIDLCEQDQKPEGLQLSCISGEGIDDVMDHVVEMLYPEEETCRIFLPYDKMFMFDRYRKVCMMKVEEETETGVIMKVSGPSSFTQAFSMYRI
ncbi:MAG: GTPase HflX [Bulleidia sp.]